MAVKEYSTFPKAQGVESNHQMKFSFILRIVVGKGDYPIYSLNPPVGQDIKNETETNTFVEPNIISFNLYLYQHMSFI